MGPQLKVEPPKPRPKPKGLGFAREVFFAGVLAELVNKTVLHPVDTIKARLQYMAASRTEKQPRLSRWPIVSDFRAGVRMLRAEISPLRSLFAGLTPSLLGVVPVSMVYMPTYELSKAYMRDTALEGTPAPAVLTGTASAIVRVPVTVLKARLQLKLHKDLWSAVTEATTQKRGLRGLYVGLNAVLVLDVIYAAVQFACIERMRAAAYRYQFGRSPPREGAENALGTGTNAAIGFATGMITSLVTEPIDVIKTRLMAQRTASGSGPTEGAYFGYRGVGHGLRRAVRAEGLVTLWRGSLPRLVIKASGSSLWFTTYMWFRKMLERPGDADR
uniref:ADP,ATP carrier protein n=1 Tax=Phaeomonas parva TaxID=124430 RepID=A0A7S1TXY9_9STRA|mmetsp:Transcript_22964/g.71401  ORF Transcript_22964/g.71401 Transcript_22964/m.71401 type:complete len:330 (+) Transcript_22964:50-1039(+)